jgi:hypothetical protein
MLLKIISSTSDVLYEVHMCSPTVLLGPTLQAWFMAHDRGVCYVVIQNHPVDSIQSVSCRQPEDAAFPRGCQSSDPGDSVSKETFRHSLSQVQSGPEFTIAIYGLQKQSCGDKPVP